MPPDPARPWCRPRHARHSVIETLPVENRAPVEEIQAAGRLAGGSATTGDDGPRVTTSRVDSETFSSARELADAFGSVVVEPTWWPADTGEITYSLFRSRGDVHYQIGSTRSEGVPIFVVVHFEAAYLCRAAVSSFPRGGC